MAFLSQFFGHVLENKLLSCGVNGLSDENKLLSCGVSGLSDEEDVDEVDTGSVALTNLKFGGS